MSPVIIKPFVIIMGVRDIEIDGWIDEQMDRLNKASQIDNWIG